MKIEISALTHVGKVRDNNEDAFIFCPDLSRKEWFQKDATKTIDLGKCGTLVAVADGMGGANCGEVASAITIQTLEHRFSSCCLETVVESRDSMRAFIRETVHLANQAILARVEQDAQTIGMGTTLVLVWMTDRYSVVAWCGDSRCYLYTRKQGLLRLSKDHSYVQELIDRHELTEEEAFDHPDSNLITRCLGDVDNSSELDFVDFDFKENMMLLLCSDGLCGYCDDEAIGAEVKNTYRQPEICRDNLLNLALEAGGEDNITILTVASECKKTSFMDFLKGLF